MQRQLKEEPSDQGATASPPIAGTPRHGILQSLEYGVVKAELSSSMGTEQWNSRPGQ
jgi:hypothetical protein